MESLLEFREKQLSELTKTLIKSKVNIASPKTQRSWNCALIAMGSVIAIELLAELLGSPLNLSIFFMLLLVAGGTSFFWGARTAKYKTWSDKLYAELAAYDPIEQIGYQKLLEDARRNILSLDAVAEWLEMEKYASRFGTPVTANKRESAAAIRRSLSDDPIHKIVLVTRYALEAAAEQLRATDEQKGKVVFVIAEVLPYVWSGGKDFADDVSSHERINYIRTVVARYGLNLPASREEALPLLLQLSAHLLDPHPNTLLEQLQSRHGVV